MWNSQKHPSDQTLLRALDRELSAGRQAALDRHLTACAPCRDRSSAFASVATDIARAHRHGEEAQTTALRRRLQVDMAERGERWSRSVSFRTRRALTTLPFAIRLTASVAAIVLALPLVRSAHGLVPITEKVEAASLPIRTLTPGAVAHIDRDGLCTGRLPTRSPIPASVRQVVLRQYQMEGVPERDYELDYLITPELGGTADPQNLWPERYESGTWNARVKDDLERLLPQLVCQGSLDLPTAQQAIAGNWIAAYKKYLRTNQPLARRDKVIDDDDDERASHDPAEAVYTTARSSSEPGALAILFAR